MEPIRNYEVINLRTDESHGCFETEDEARGCVAYDRLTAWEIIYIETGIRVDAVDLYEGNDDRVLQGLGYPNASERDDALEVSLEHPGALSNLPHDA